MKHLTFTEKIAVWVTDHIGTIEFFLFCNLMVACTLIFPKTVTVIQFVSSAWLQLVLLPLIMIGQNIQNKENDRIANKHYQILLKHEEKLDRLLENKKK